MDKQGGLARFESCWTMFSAPIMMKLHRRRLDMLADYVNSGFSGLRALQSLRQSSTIGVGEHESL
jgi:hypothetical protein